MPWPCLYQCPCRACSNALAIRVQWNYESTDIKSLGAEKWWSGTKTPSKFFSDFFKVILNFPNDLENSYISVKQHLALIFLKYFFLSDNTRLGVETFWTGTKRPHEFIQKFARSSWGAPLFRFPISIFCFLHVHCSSSSHSSPFISMHCTIQLRPSRWLFFDCLSYLRLLVGSQHQIKSCLGTAHN